MIFQFYYTNRAPRFQLFFFPFSFSSAAGAALKRQTACVNILFFIENQAVTVGHLKLDDQEAVTMRGKQHDRI